ncbi:MAG: hypothetical protein KDB14_14330 [Planctomycetales bacterium]|nr:hypothetical protein [Planctomycetales bacterium]
MFWTDPRFREFLNSTQAQVVTWMTVLLILLVVAYYLVKRFRDQSGDDRSTANDMLTNFREMREQGDISEFEFRRLKTVLGDQLVEELTESTDAGKGN